MRAAAGVHVDKADRLVLIINNGDGSVIVRMVRDGGGVIGLGDEAAQVAVRSAPRVGIAGDVIVPVLGGVYVLMAQGDLIARARSKRTAQVRKVVYIVGGEAALIIEQVHDAGVRRDRQVLRIADGDAEDFGEHTADRDAVADDSDGAVRVIRGDLSERFGRSARHLCIGLRAVKREAVRFKYELMQLFRAPVFKVPEKFCLPRPHMYLAQTCVKLHRDAVPARYRRGGHARAVKVA